MPVTNTPVGPAESDRTVLVGDPATPPTLLITGQAANPGDPADANGPLAATDVGVVEIAVAVSVPLIKTFPADTDRFGLWFVFGVKKTNAADAPNIYKAALLIQSSCLVEVFFGPSRAVQGYGLSFRFQWAGGHAYYVTGWIELDSTPDRGTSPTVPAPTAMLTDAVTMSGTLAAGRLKVGKVPSVVFSTRKKD